MKHWCDDLRIFTIEDSEEKRAVSREELRTLGWVWTVDDPGIEHIDGLCESWDIRLSSSGILRTLVKGEPPSVPSPRLVGHRSTPLIDFEISEIVIDQERLRIDLKWERKSGRWHVPSKKFDSEWSRSISNRPNSHYGKLLFATADIKCNIQSLQLLSARGFCLNLPNSPLTRLYNTFGEQEPCSRWMRQLMQYGHIREDDLPLLRHQLKTRKIGEEEFIKAMVLLPENRFRLKDYLRIGSQWYGDWGKEN